MDRYVHRENAHYRRLLAEPNVVADRVRHALLKRLLADEIAQDAAAPAIHHTDNEQNRGRHDHRFYINFAYVGGMFVLSFAAIWAFWFVERLRGASAPHV